MRPICGVFLPDRSLFDQRIGLTERSVSNGDAFVNLFPQSDDYTFTNTAFLCEFKLCLMAPEAG